MRLLALALLLLPLIDNPATAGPIRSRRAYQPVYQPSPQYLPAEAVGEPVDAGTAMAEVNAARARRGLAPFQHDPALSRAAEVCARLRAQYGLAGHTRDDFAALEPGVSASAAGCGAVDSSWGWLTCCTYDNYRWAGAAVVVRADGTRFMHLFVRN